MIYATCTYVRCCLDVSYRFSSTTNRELRSVHAHTRFPCWCPLSSVLVHHANNAAARLHLIDLSLCFKLLTVCVCVCVCLSTREGEPLPERVLLLKLQNNGLACDGLMEEGGCGKDVWIVGGMDGIGMLRRSGYRERLRVACRMLIDSRSPRAACFVARAASVSVTSLSSSSFSTHTATPALPPPPPPHPLPPSTSSSSPSSSSSS